MGAQLDGEFWLHPDWLRRTVCLGCIPHYVELFTDALLTRWGGTLDQLTVGRARESPLAHINILEMVVVQRVLLHFALILERDAVMVRLDNTTAVAYLNRQGGTRYSLLHRTAAEILLWEDAHLASLRVRPVPGTLNAGADRMS